MNDRQSRPNLRGLETRALVRGGYFDRRDALDHGISDRMLTYHVGQGRFERLYPGVFRLCTAPLAAHDDLLLAWVWSNYRGAVSHESALALYGLSDVMPSRVQLTVPPGFRRDTTRYDLHWSRLSADEIRMYEGVQVTAPARTIVDAAAVGTGLEQIHKAIDQALRRTLVDSAQLDAAARRPHYRKRRLVLPFIEGALAHAAA
ncbi:MAG TPA: type IV toxin-antitoxin system AbiEi family antitoxin domain-containing protein [Chloroflexota bacterium]|jgi:predicted transcriptional regulator of viral defense system|nr:type IV toxin-antitoxin system AbiEi family antitoxin domain-containing protein [Chloroflexota bacterium]